MGKVMSHLNPFRNFNIEARAHKVISQAKPTPAPKYQVDQLEYERILKDHPEIVEESLKKHEVLNKHLRDVFVTSQTPKEEDSRYNSSRPLPLNRTSFPDFEYGAKEPAVIPHGKTTLKNVLKFITDHHTNAKINSVQRISDEYLLSEENVRNILKYYKVFEMYIPVEKRVKARFAGPTVTRVEVKKRQLPLLPKSEKNDT